MESHRRIGGHRTLLPFEVGLCESLGISPKEYFDFLDLTDAYNLEQKKGYENVPLIVNGGLETWIVIEGTKWVGLTLWGKIAVTVALAAAAYLLTPKPKDQSGGPRLDIGGIQGRSRFNPTSGFESLQDLAALGSFIPLVYGTSRLDLDGLRVGGVRVSSQLLWSQVRTAQYGETINAIVLFSNGEIKAKPQFESLALGETYLSDLPLSKQKVYFSRGKLARDNNRLQGVADTQTPKKYPDNVSTPEEEDDQYVEGSAKNTNNYLSRGQREYDDVDPFKLKVFAESYSSGNANFNYNSSFCSTKTPSTNNTFGVYSPMPNGNAYKITWELILLLRDGDDGVKRDLRHKMGKCVHLYPRQVGITNHSTGHGNQVVLEPHQTNNISVNYRIFHDTSETAFIDSSIENPDPKKKYNKFSPWGSSDAKGVADTTRERVDDGMNIGDQYMVGSTLMTAIQEDNGNIWVSGEEGFDKAIQLKADEGGYLEFRNTDETALPYESLIVQKVELATFSNARKCSVTEIGLKSTVWRQISGFPNVNEMPSQERISSYESKNGSIQLGTVSKYVKRLSFFKIQAKELNSGNSFVDVTSKVLCVQGSSPTAQYNAIYINHHSPSQYEFRFLPVAGNVVLNEFDDRVVHVLGYAEHLQHHRNNSLGLTVSYHAKEGQLPLSGELDEGSNFTNNPEWTRGGLGAGLPIVDDDGNVITGGPVNNFTPSFQGNDVFAPPTYSSIHTIFQPNNVTTYTGTGPGNVTQTWTNVTQRNLKGVPADGGNSYYSPYHGIAAIAIPISAENWEWHFIFGGTLIPNGIAVGGIRRANDIPMESTDFYGPIRGNDGVDRKFKVAKNPSSLGGGEDWRFTDSGGNLHFAVHVVEADRSEPTTSTPVIRSTTTTKGVGTGLQVAVTTKTDGVNTYKKFALHTSGDGYYNGDTVTIDSESPTQTLSLIAKNKPDNVPDVDEHSDWATDGTAGFYTDYWQLIEHNPNNAIADYFLFDSESSSHENGPEHQLTYINEIVDPVSSDNSTAQFNYEQLAIAGVRIGATNTLSSFNSFSAFIEEGIKVDRLIPDLNPNSGTGYLTRNSERNSTDNFVEIAHDLLTNKAYGSGDIVGHDGVDRKSMIEGARYCRANGFFWNGVIDSKFNLREFIFEHAGYNFLDFSILGGRFSLRPSFPMDGNYKIKYDATIESGINIKALFTDGNMKDIKITFLTPEERKMFKATVIHRDDQVNQSTRIGGFPENIAKTYAYNPEGEAATTFIPKAEQLPEEVFDLSNWCTSETHAKLFAALALSIRKEVDHGIVFQTPPSSVFGLVAGDYIRVLTEATHTSRFNNGSIDEDGVVISRSTISGSINVYAWSPGTLDGIESKTFSVNSNGVNSAGLKNKLFAQVDTTEEDRIYKVESITYGEEGFIQIAASHAPLINDKLAVLHNANPNSAVNGVNFFNRFPELRK